MIVQEDGAPLYYANVDQFMNVKLSQSCVGRGGWKAWPLRSLDLTFRFITFEKTQFIEHESNRYELKFNYSINIIVVLTEV